MKWQVALLVVLLVTTFFSGILTVAMDMGWRAWFIRATYVALLTGVVALAIWLFQQWQTTSPPPPLLATIDTEIIPPGRSVTRLVAIHDLRFTDEPDLCYDVSFAHSDRRDVRRCISHDGEVLDPCFLTRGFISNEAVPRSETFLCLLSPWDTDTEMGIKVFRARIVFAPPPWIEGPKPKPGQDRPWALELANGARCMRPFGRDVDNSYPPGASYKCWGPGDRLRTTLTGVVRGYPNRQRRIWTVQFASLRDQTGGFQITQVRQAWG